MLIQDIIKNRSYDKVAVKQASRSITYGELNSNVLNLVGLLNDKKAIIGNNVGLFLPNSISYVIGYFAITFMNKVIVPIDVKSKQLELVRVVEFCEIQLIITSTKYVEYLKKCLEEYHYAITIFDIEEKVIYEVNAMKKFIPLTQGLGGTNENDVAIMLHTSGTTSMSKGVMLTHKNLITNIRSNIKSLNLSENEKGLIALPMYFGYCNTAQFLTHLYLGATIIIMDSFFIPKKFFDIVEKEQISNFTAVPSMLLALLECDNINKYNINTLRHICFGGGVMPSDKLKKLIFTFKSVGFVHTYGQTEASPRLTALLPDMALKKIGSVGMPIPDVKIKIVDSNGDEVPVNEIGEVIASGDNIMKGYYKNIEGTKNVIKDGWLHTGDLGRMDKEGYLYIVGRVKNIIICGGINIYPEEIEEVLLNSSMVQEACVVGEYNEMYGEVPVAKIKINGSGEDIKKRIIDYCRHYLSDYKIPRRFDIVDDFSKTTTGKIKRSLVNS